MLLIWFLPPPRLDLSFDFVRLLAFQITQMHDKDTYKHIAMQNYYTNLTPVCFSWILCCCDFGCCSWLPNWKFSPKWLAGYCEKSYRRTVTINNCIYLLCELLQNSSAVDMLLYFHSFFSDWNKLHVCCSGNCCCGMLSIASSWLSSTLVPFSPLYRSLGQSAVTCYRPAGWYSIALSAQYG